MVHKNPAVSVIIPLYNAEKFIGECLTSLANQTFQNFEIIIADDCSTDNSRAGVENFFAVFGDRLKLMMLSRNSGCAAIPRNFALREACGKYVYFLDSDDLLSETALEELCACAESFNADVVHSEKCLAFSEEGGKICAEPVSFQTGEFVTEPTLETFDISKRIEGFIRKRFIWWGCNKLFRRKLLVDNEITFPALKRYEDFIFVLKCLVAAQNYVRVPYVNYFYRLREDSMSHKVYNAVELSKDLMEIFCLLNEFMNDNKFFRENPQYKYPLLDFFIEGQLELISEGLFIRSNLDPADVFNFFREKIFTANPEDNVALTAYLFVATNIFKLYTKQQAMEIDKLKRKLSERGIKP